VLEAGIYLRIDDQTTEIKALSKSDDLNIIQFPPGNKIQIESNPAKHSVMNISVYDIKGNHLFSDKYSGVKPGNLISVSCPREHTFFQ